MAGAARTQGMAAMVRQWLDKVGIIISSMCLAHCLALPIAAALLSIAARSAALPEWLHLALISAALPVTTVALYQGWRRHGRFGVACVGAGGLALLGLGLVFHEGVIAAPDPVLADRVFTSIGAVMLASAHWRNWRLSVGG